MKKYGVVGVMVLVIMSLMLMSSMVMADCDDYALDPIPGWNNEFRWVGQSWNYWDWACEWTGDHHSQQLPYVVSGTGNCSADYLLQHRADGCSCSTTCSAGDRRRFRAACNEHDKCYASTGVSKATCDANFLGNMNYICDHHYFGSCKVDAAAFYAAVLALGGDSYDNGQQWGRDHCFMSAIPTPMNNAAPADAMTAHSANDPAVSPAETLPLAGSLKEDVVIVPNLDIPAELQGKTGNLYAIAYWVDENILFQITPAGPKQITDGIEPLMTATLAETAEFNILGSAVDLSDFYGTLDIYVGCATKDDLSDLVYNYYRVIFQ